MQALCEQIENIPNRYGKSTSLVIHFILLVGKVPPTIDSNKCAVQKKKLYN